MTKTGNMRRMVIYTVIMVAVLAGTLMGIINYMFAHSENEAAERLRLETVKFKNNINIQLRSDMETLRAMASLVSERFDDEESYAHVCKNFEAFGFCENIGILVSDNRLITKYGSMDVSGSISFESEAARGEYISGRIRDITNPDRYVIRSAVPIKSKSGQTVAMMYGTIDVKNFARRYQSQADAVRIYLGIIEGKNGQFIIDTKQSSVKNITNLAGIEYKDNYSFDKLVNELSVGNAGYTAFMDDAGAEYLYVRYDSVDISDWRLMVAQPESVIFSGTRATVQFLIFTAFLVFVIVAIYIICVLGSINKMLRISSFAAEIRRHLLEMNQRDESLEDALKQITEFAESRSAFIMDSNNEEHHYIVPEEITCHTLPEEELAYFNNKLILYAARHRESHGAAVYVSQIRCDETLKREMPDFYDFMKAHNMECIKYAVVINNNSNINVLGVMNPKNRKVFDLLRKIAVCFSMAVYNNKYLKRTEHMALTDSLTGIANRMAFAQDIKDMNRAESDMACVYIDVNELHFFNNKFGHAAGDQMLIYIAEALGEEFKDSHIYRMGGDEFLILCSGITAEQIDARLKNAVEEIEEMKYHIAVGVQYGDGVKSVEEMVNEAEQIMYDCKTRYYQDKGLGKVRDISKGDVITFETGVRELDACLSVMTLRYLAVYYVSFEKDRCTRILAPSYFMELNDEAGVFSTSMKRYVYEFVKPEYHRALLSFIDYESLNKSIDADKIPGISYERIDGERVNLKVYPTDKYGEGMDVIWIFEKSE